MERNYNTYLAGMEKGKADKLFFVNHLCLDDYDYIIDFGCGAGEVIKFCKENSTHATCYGIDKDPFMRNTAGENCKNLNIIFLDSLSQLNITSSDIKILLIFSSVLHEVNNYWFTLEKFIKNHSGHITIAIRDMYWNYELEGFEANRVELAKIIKHANHDQLAEFVIKYGMKWERDIYHFLLKYSYVDNWELELEENYFSAPWETFEYLAKEIIYDRKYVLPFKKERVREDFGINLLYPTHRQFIINC